MKKRALCPLSGVHLTIKPENGRSQSWEASKTKKIAVPKVGNSKKCQIQLFPTLGTEKIPV